MQRVPGIASLDRGAFKSVRESLSVSDVDWCGVLGALMVIGTLGRSVLDH